MEDDDKLEVEIDLTAEQTHVAMMLFFLCYQNALQFIISLLGPSPAADCHLAVLRGLKNLDTTLPIDDEARATQFVVTALESTIEIEDDS